MHVATCFVTYSLHTSLISKIIKNKNVKYISVSKTSSVNVGNENFSKKIKNYVFTSYKFQKAQATLKPTICYSKLTKKDFKLTFKETTSTQ